MGGLLLSDMKKLLVYFKTYFSFVCFLQFIKEHVFLMQLPSMQEAAIYLCRCTRVGVCEYPRVCLLSLHVGRSVFASQTQKNSAVRRWRLSLINLSHTVINEALWSQSESLSQ